MQQGFSLGISLPYHVKQGEEQLFILQRGCQVVSPRYLILTATEAHQMTNLTVTYTGMCMPAVVPFPPRCLQIDQVS